MSQEPHAETGSELHPNPPQPEQADLWQCARGKPRVLYIDERIPHRDLGAGYPRGNEILNGFVRIGAGVCLYAIAENERKGDLSDDFRDLDPAIKILSFATPGDFSDFLRENLRGFDLVWVSRPNVFEVVSSELKALGGDVRMVYDAEAIFSVREEQRRLIFGESADPDLPADCGLRQEMDLAARADVVVTVSAKDAACFRAQGCRETVVLSHCQKVRVATPDFHSRRDLLFVGNLDHDQTPNVDSVCWFVYAVLPLLKRKIPDLVLHLVGTSASARVRALQCEQVVLHGKVDSLDRLYDQCRLFVAPTRFSAGIPIKVIEAAAQGLPVVATHPLCEQLGWTAGVDLWASPARAVSFAQTILEAYHDPLPWGRVRENALNRVREQYSSERFLEVLRGIL